MRKQRRQFSRIENDGKTVKKVRERAKIRNRYNHVPHLTQDTNVEVTNLQ